MAYNIGAPVSFGFTFNDFQFTYLLSGVVTLADVGKGVTLDTTAANTMKLAGVGDPIYGRLETFEDRISLGIKVGNVSRKFKDKLPVKAGLTGFDVVALGDTVVGATANGGDVKALNSGSAKTPNHAFNVVIEVGSGFAVVEKL